MTPIRPFAERFWEKVQKSDNPDGCWLWTGSTTRGYGYIATKHKQAPLRAHRVSYELAYGPIPPEKLVCHRCDNPACVRPDHLFLGTDYDNAMDREAKHRGRWTKQQAPTAKRGAATAFRQSNACTVAAPLPAVAQQRQE